MGLGDEELISPESVSQSYRCPLCMEVLVEPVFSGGRTCQHVFCRSCVAEWLQHGNTCPTCRVHMSMQSLVPHLMMQQFLDELHVRCTANCGWSGRLDVRPAHELRCVVMKSPSAGIAVVARRIAHHLSLEQRALWQTRPQNKDYFPASAAIRCAVESWRRAIQTLPLQSQVAALKNVFELSKLRTLGVDISDIVQKRPALMDAYIADFCVSQFSQLASMDKEAQQRIFSLVLRRYGSFSSISEMHVLFWRHERLISWLMSLLSNTPLEMPAMEQLIRVAPSEQLLEQVFALACTALVREFDDSATLDKAKAASVLQVSSRAASDKQFFLEWLSRKAAVGQLLEDLEMHSSKQYRALPAALYEFWLRAETLALLLRQLACPLEWSREKVSHFLSQISGQSMCSVATVSGILTTAQSDLSQRVDSETLSEDVLQAWGTFFECWVLDVCFLSRNVVERFDTQFVNILCGLAAGLALKLNASSECPCSLSSIDESVIESEGMHDGYIAYLPDGVSALPRSNPFSLALLRKLREVESQLILQALSNLLEEFQMKFWGGNDSSLATRYVIVCEELFSDDTCNFDLQDVIDLGTVFSERNTPARFLQSVGRIRWMLAQYATIICQEPRDAENFRQFTASVNNFFGGSISSSTAHFCHSSMLFLLKCIERQRGVGFLRKTLLACRSDYIERDDEWEDKDEDSRAGYFGEDGGHWIDQLRAMYGNHYDVFTATAASLPVWSPPHCDMMDFCKAQCILRDIMETGDMTKLDQFAHECTQRTYRDRQLAIGGLLLALCQEVGQLAACPSLNHVRDQCCRLHDWLATASILPVTAQESVLLRIFAGDGNVFEMFMSHWDKPLLNVFSISTDCGSDAIIMWRLLGHLAAMLIAAPPSSLLAVLKTLMLDPDKLCNAKCFLPGMEEDIRNVVMKALLRRGENIWKFKSHWYKCKCGYTFFLGECGRPMQVATCPDCKAPIGGRDHSNTNSTRVDDETSRSLPGYTLPPASKSFELAPTRDLSAASSGVVQLLIHGAMLCGLCAHRVNLSVLDSAISSATRLFADLVASESACTMNSDESCEAQYIMEQWFSNWQSLAGLLNSNYENLAVFLHDLLSSLHHEGPDELTDGDLAPSQLDDLNIAIRPGSASEMPGTGRLTDWSTLNLYTRFLWERKLQSEYLHDRFDGFDSRVSSLLGKYTKCASCGKLEADIKDIGNPYDVAQEERCQSMPKVWELRQVVSMPVLRKFISCEQNVVDRLPVLCTALQEPHLPGMLALRKLAGVFEWNELVRRLLSGRITRAHACSLTVADFLEGLGQERADAECAFLAFQSAWKVAWKFVDQYGCLQLPANLRSVELSHDTKMIFCVADSVNEGICALALTEKLVEWHNTLAQAAAAANGFSMGKVASRSFAQHDSIDYGPKQFMSCLRCRCAAYGSRGELTLDLAPLERELCGHFARPEIVTKTTTFQWLEAWLAGDAKWNDLEIPQEAIPQCVALQLDEELQSSSDTAAILCQHKLRMLSFFFSQLDGEIDGVRVGEMLISDCLENLLMDSERLPSDVLQKEARLKHMDAVLRLLHDAVNSFDSIDAQYKCDLPSKLAGELTVAKKYLPVAFGRFISSFAKEHLREAFLGESVPMLEVLIQIDELQDNLDELREHFPAPIQMKHWVAVCMAINAATESLLFEPQHHKLGDFFQGSRKRRRKGRKKSSRG